MNIFSQKTIGKIIIWIAFEIWLSALGLDSLADYSEFIFQTKIAQLNIINQSQELEGLRKS